MKKFNFNKPHIYKRQIIATGKFYVGKHKGNNAKYKGSGIDWLKDYRKFVKNRETDINEEILEYVDDIPKLNEREIYWLEYFDAANNPLFYNRTNKSYGIHKFSKESLKKKSTSLKESWYKKRKEQGLIIEENNILDFIKSYPNIKITENNKHCINYCYNNNLNIKDIICKCNKGIKRFQNYTQGYKQYCSQKCANLYNKEKSLQTRENNGLWDNSKLRLRKKEIENLSKKEIEHLRRKRISNKQKGKTKLGNSHGKPILQFDPQGNFIKEWPSIRQAGSVLKGTNGETIRKCLKGLQKTAYGFKWKYLEN